MPPRRDRASASLLTRAWLCAATIRSVAFRDRVGRDQLRIVEDLDLEPGARGRQREPVVGGRDEDAGDLDAFFEQTRERRRAEIARADQGDAKFSQGVQVARLRVAARGDAFAVRGALTGGLALVATGRFALAVVDRELLVVLARRVLLPLPDFSASSATASSSVSASTWSRSGSVALTSPCLT